jgi:hypothetical protein
VTAIEQAWNRYADWHAEHGEFPGDQVSGTMLLAILDDVRQELELPPEAIWQPKPVGRGA